MAKNLLQGKHHNKEKSELEFLKVSEILQL